MTHTDDIQTEEGYTPFSLLILGNGFDKDLGMKTAYRDFAESTFWPFTNLSNKDQGSLACFLNERKEDVNTWFDLEELLAEFAQNINKTIEQAEKDFQDLDKVIKSLKEYLQAQEDEFCKKMDTSMHAKRDTPARNVLQRFLKNKEIHCIYTFNYTNVYRIAMEIMFEAECKMFSHVHGSIKDNNIILGTGDQREFNPAYFGFYKSANSSYKSTNLVEDLAKADEVYIFGHSLGTNDHDYFFDFFQDCIHYRQNPNSHRKRKIRIFTYDDNSELEIKKQLMKLIDRHLIGLYAHCDFKILKTCPKYQDSWMLDDDF